MSIIQSLYGEEHEYKVNGATYVVSAAFKHTGRKEDNTSFPTCVKRILTRTARKEDNIAVEKEAS